MGDVTLNYKSYSNIASAHDIHIDYHEASYSYTDQLDQMASSNDVQVRVIYYDENNCKDLMSFEELPYSNSEYYEDIVILNFGSTPTVLSKVRFDEQELAGQIRPEVTNRSPTFIPWLVYQVIKRAAMAAVGSVVDFGIQMGMERLVGGHSSWQATWDAIEIDKYSLLEAAIGGAFSDSKYVNFAINILSPSVRYILNTPVDDWTAPGFAQSFGEGAMMAAVDFFLGKVMHRIDVAVSRYKLIPVTRINKMVLELTQKIGANPSLIPKIRYVVKAWNLAYFAPSARTNTTILESLTNAIIRGTKETTFILSKVSIPEINLNTIEHIFRGSTNNGVHHVSALIERSDVQLIKRVSTKKGCYKATIKFPNGQTKPKDFFPDEWDEIKTIKEIEHAFGNKVEKPNWPSGQYLGKSSVNTGEIPIRIQVVNGKITSAYPYFGN